jgi:ribosomal protein S12 methylthiotransferase accessory factor
MKHPDDRRSGGQFIIHYELEHQVTQYGTGQFACFPREDLDFEGALEYIQDHPNDDFMHKHLLHLAGKFGPNLTRQLIQTGKNENAHLTALMYEACILNERLRSLRSKFEAIDVKALAQYTPLIYINWSLQEGMDEKAYWLELFSENILQHKPPRRDKEIVFPIPFDQEVMDAVMSRVMPISALLDRPERDTTPNHTVDPHSPAATQIMAMERLKSIDFKLGPETENQASLSPCAVQMPWFLHIRTSTGRNHWELTGVQTSYGKGLHKDQARASCFMEVVERVSSFASFDSHDALHYKDGLPLMQGRYEDLIKQSYEALNPNDMHLEVPYDNQPLYWVCAERIGEQGAHSIYVPAQLVFLFCNLDEISLTSGLPSSGLASGNTLEEAKLHALLEVVERDAERVMPYCKERCFLLESDTPLVADILRRANQAGIQVQFLNITTELGVPCYKAFIQGPGGELVKGCAAHLDGKRAAVSALLEVPFHLSWFRPVPAPPGLNAVQEDTLPDYSSGNVSRDLELLERLLITNGYQPIYVNLTREDLDIPVVKAIIPGLEIFGEFDQFSSLSLRQFVHYLQLLQ